MNIENIYLGTDWHLYHKNIIGYDRRDPNFKKILLKNIRDTLTEDDFYINLGDVIFKTMGELAPIMESLPGKHLLIMGNHDRNKPNWYKSKGFFYVSRLLEYKKILFSHSPRNMDEFPHLEINIHGHFHRIDRKDLSRTEQYYEFYDNEKNFCMTIDDMEEDNWRPKLLTEFLTKINYTNF